MIYNVSTHGSDANTGEAEHPFRTISKAAKIARAGDVVRVHGGTYREWVRPEQAGTSDIHRITYEAVEGETVIIKGSEEVKDWEHVQGTLWKIVRKNTFFGEYNPYAQTIDGDWMVSPKGWRVHAGDVYLNGVSMYEAPTLEEATHPKVRETFTCLGRTEKMDASEKTLFQWYTEVTEEETYIYANFQGLDPRKECVEINVRKCCFYPEKVGINYITVRGFEMAHAATHWAPPTGDQVGMLGAHWSKGWIIEGNILHDAKCSALSIGKEGSTGTQDSFRTHQKSGYECQLEAVFRGLQIGWNREKIGSHVIRYNRIYDCGQNGIVGNLGCAFSHVYRNHIYNIGRKHEFFGWEIAGIKFHAPIDTQIYENRIHHCIFGFWMDWQVQGTRISRNLLYDNLTDGNIEVTHGPCIVDHNVFASRYGLDNHAQGTAFVNNLFCGRMHKIKVSDRATPYHLPHSTAVAGYAYVYGGDDRYYNNLFVGVGEYTHDVAFYGTAGYNPHPSSYQGYLDQLDFSDGRDHEKYGEIEQAVYINYNAYFNGAKSYHQEVCKILETNWNPCVTLMDEGEDVYLTIDLPLTMDPFEGEVQTTETLGHVRIVDGIYDAPDGSHVRLDLDYFGYSHSKTAKVGPFAKGISGKQRIKLWGDGVRGTSRSNA